MNRVYVAAPAVLYDFAEGVHARLDKAGLIASSACWTDYVRRVIADGKSESDLPPAEKARLAKSNDEALRCSQACIVLGYPGMGGEMWAEAARAQVWGIPTFFVGRMILSAFRDDEGARRCMSVDDAIARIVVLLRAQSAVAIDANLAEMRAAGGAR